MYVPFSPPDLTEYEANRVKEIILSGWITTGPEVKSFEERISSECRTERAVCLSSATAALELTLRILGIGEGDEVIVPAYTYTASCSVICHVGATPVMVDSKRDSVEMDPALIEAAITSRTKAVIAVDIAGIICDFDSIYKAVEKKSSLFTPASSLQKALGRIAVIADSAHGFGAEKNGIPSGGHADFTAFSFHAVKNLTTAEGGAVTWKNIKGIDSGLLYDRFSAMALHGQSRRAFNKTTAGEWEYDIIGTYYKCNMTDITAAIGLAQLDRYDSMLARRHEIIEKYNKAFKDLRVDLLSHRGEAHRSSGHLYLVRVKGIDEERRNRIISAMADRNIACNVHYKPLPMFTAYKNLGFDIKDFPNAYRLFENEITLPLYSRLTDRQVSYITENFISCVEEYRS